MEVLYPLIEEKEKNYKMNRKEYRQAAVEMVVFNMITTASTTTIIPVHNAKLVFSVFKFE